jgi:hypothetical protein
VRAGGRRRGGEWGGRRRGKARGRGRRCRGPCGCERPPSPPPVKSPSLVRSLLDGPEKGRVQG